MPTATREAELLAELKAARDGETIFVPPGLYRTSLRLSKRLTLKCDGAVTFDGEHRRANAIRVPDGSGLVTIEGPFTFRNYTSHTIFATKAAGLTVEGAQILGSGGSGILTGMMGNVLIDGVTVLGGQSHGVYFSEKLWDCELRNSTLRDCAKCGCQANAHKNSRNYQGRDVRVTGNLISGMGNAACQFSAIRGGVIARNKIADCRQDIVLWSDSAGRRFLCHDISCEDQPGRYNVEPGCTGILLPN
jgi:hypothetical protein